MAEDDHNKVLKQDETMKTYLDCIPCFISQSLEAARMSSDDENVHKKVLEEVMKHLQTISFNAPPPETSI
ncbi:MAG TPA: hypothetical protein ENI42_00530 [Thermoplasmatales archaeon]|nr:hypothetical protein [Thermoplasmatales archaeon]